MDYFKAIKLRCLLATIQPNEDAIIRRIFRWYSHHLVTPLHLVEKLPLEDVLVAYFEHHYAELEDPILEEELFALTDSEEELQDRKRLELEDEQWVKAVEEEAQKQKEKDLKAAPSVEPPPDIVKTFDDSNLIDNWADSDPLGIPSTEKP